MGNDAIGDEDDDDDDDGRTRDMYSRRLALPLRLVSMQSWNAAAVMTTEQQ